MFEEYFDTLVKEMRRKYPDKILSFVMDNLAAHKTAYVMRIA